MYKINVYKIWWQEKDGVYVGSTKQSLSKRMAKHRITCRSGKRFKIYEAMRTNGYDFRYILLDSYEVSCKDEQLKYEQRHIDLLQPNLNDRRAYNTPEDTKKMDQQYRDSHKGEAKLNGKRYRQSHKDEIKIKHKQYRETHKDKIITRQKTKIECECGSVIINNSFYRHLRSQKHIKKINMYYLDLLPFQ